jgi:hypothetical protein
MPTKVSDQDFIRTWRATGGRATAVMKALGMQSVRGVYSRRAKLEERYGIGLPSAGDGNGMHRGDAGASLIDYRPRLTLDGFSGQAVIFSDAHFWPGLETVAYRALLEVIKELKPKLVIANGDILDGAKVSRFPPDGWEKRPRMYDELEEVKTRMAAIRHAYRGARHVRTIGNHCTRFDRYLAVNAGEFEGIEGFRLKDHLPEWEETVSFFINKHTMVKHRLANGQHAAFNNTLKSGTNIFTGHTHRLQVTPWGDYNGRRYGCETGCLAEIGGPQFAYAEDGPSAGCSGFAVATFDKTGRLLYPELVEVIDGTAWFRGAKVAERKKARAA